MQHPIYISWFFWTIYTLFVMHKDKYKSHLLDILKALKWLSYSCISASCMLKYFLLFTMRISFIIPNLSSISVWLVIITLPFVYTMDLISTFLEHNIFSGRVVSKFRMHCLIVSDKSVLCIACPCSTVSP